MKKSPTPGSRQQQALLNKTTMNLAVREAPFNFLILIPAVILILIAAAALGKFGVADRLAAVDAARSEVHALETRLNTLQESYSDYAEVEQEYNRYTYNGYDRTLYDRLEVLNLMERRVSTVCTVKQVSISGTRLSLTVSGLTLEEVSALIRSLEEDPMVISASIPSFNAEGIGGTSDSILLNVELSSAEREGG